MRLNEMRLEALCIVFVIAGMCLIAGCATTPPSGSGGATTAATPTTAAVTTRIPGSTQAVDFNRLIGLLPAPPAGWTGDEPVGGRYSDKEGSWSMASREYTHSGNDELRAQVTIVDSAYSDVGGWETWRSFAVIETTEGYYHSDTVAGYPAWEVFTKPSSYGKWVGINERFLVFVSIEGGSKADLDLFVNSINYRGIAALG